MEILGILLRINLIDPHIITIVQQSGGGLNGCLLPPSFAVDTGVAYPPHSSSMEEHRVFLDTDCL